MSEDFYTELTKNEFQKLFNHYKVIVVKRWSKGKQDRLYIDCFPDGETWTALNKRPVGCIDLVNLKYTNESFLNETFTEKLEDTFETLLDFFAKRKAIQEQEQETPGQEQETQEQGFFAEIISNVEKQEQEQEQETPGQEQETQEQLEPRESYAVLFIETVLHDMCKCEVLTEQAKDEFYDAFLQMLEKD